MPVRRRAVGLGFVVVMGVSAAIRRSPPSIRSLRLATVNDFEQISPAGRVRLVRGSGNPDARGYFLVIDGSIARRFSGLSAGRVAFREEMARLDPSTPSVGQTEPDRSQVVEAAIAGWYAERRGLYASSGGRKKVRR